MFSSNSNRFRKRRSALGPREGDTLKRQRDLLQALYSNPGSASATLPQGAWTTLFPSDILFLINSWMGTPEIIYSCSTSKASYRFLMLYFPKFKNFQLQITESGEMPSYVPDHPYQMIRSTLIGDVFNFPKPTSLENIRSLHLDRLDSLDDEFLCLLPRSLVTLILPRIDYICSGHIRLPPFLKTLVLEIRLTTFFCCLSSRASFFSTLENLVLVGESVANSCFPDTTTLSPFQGMSSLKSLGLVCPSSRPGSFADRMSKSSLTAFLEWYFFPSTSDSQALTQLQLWAKEESHLPSYAFLAGKYPLLRDLTYSIVSLCPTLYKPRQDMYRQTIQLNRQSFFSRI